MKNHTHVFPELRHCADNWKTQSVRASVGEWVLLRSCITFLDVVRVSEQQLRLRIEPQRWKYIQTSGKNQDFLEISFVCNDRNCKESCTDELI